MKTRLITQGKIKNMNWFGAFLMFLMAGILTISLSACGAFVGSPDDDTPQEESSGDDIATSVGTFYSSISPVNSAAPSDSSGASASMKLSFAGDTDKSYNLVNSADSEDDTEVILANGIHITVAKVNIAMIKIKASKEPSAEEKELKKKVHERGKAQDKEEDDELVNELDGGSTASLMAAKDKDKGNSGDSASDTATSSSTDSDTSTSTSTGSSDKAAKDKKKADRKKTEELEYEKEAELDKDTKFTGPYVVDLITGKVTPPLPEVSLTDGTFHRIEFKLKKYRSETEGDPLNGNVLYVEGYYLDEDGEKVTFAVLYNKSENIQIKGDNGFTLEQGLVNNFVIVFDIKQWFAGVDLVKFKTAANERRLERLNEKLADLDVEIAAKVQEKMAKKDAKKAEQAAKKALKIKTRLGISEDVDLIVHSSLSQDSSVRIALKRIKFNIKRKLKMGKKDKDGNIDTSELDVEGVLDEDTADTDDLEFEKEEDEA